MVKGIIVFTNGAFDLFHVGHLRFLQQASQFGDQLIVGINTNESARKIKGPGRPIIPLDQRLEIIQNLWFVTQVIPFSEKDPLELIKTIKPDILVKGEDWKEKDIIGADFVKKRGGMVKRIQLLPNVSTSLIIQKIKEKLDG